MADYAKNMGPTKKVATAGSNNLQSNILSIESSSLTPLDDTPTTVVDAQKAAQQANENEPEHEINVPSWTDAQPVNYQTKKIAQKKQKADVEEYSIETTSLADPGAPETVTNGAAVWGSNLAQQKKPEPAKPAAAQ